MKKYTIRVYIPNEFVGLVMNEGIDSGLFVLRASFQGVGDVLAIYDIETSLEGLKTLIQLGFPYLPLNNYGDFVITCPNCGCRIDDDMILNVYDDKLLGGYNISCDRQGCGYQRANVEFIGQ